MKYFLTVIMVLCLVTGAFTQGSILGFSTPGPDLDFLLQATNLGFDGKASSIIGGASPALGVKIPVSFMGLAFDPGAYGYTNIDIRNGQEPNFVLGGFVGIKFPVLNVFIGVGTDVYKEGQGFVKLFSKESGFLVLAFDLKFSNPFK